MGFTQRENGEPHELWHYKVPGIIGTAGCRSNPEDIAKGGEISENDLGEPTGLTLRVYEIIKKS